MRTQSGSVLRYRHQWELARGVAEFALFRVESLPARVQSFSRLQSEARLEYLGPIVTAGIRCFESLTIDHLNSARFFVTRLE